MVGVDPFDSKGAKYNLPPVEGYNMWPVVSGANTTSPRTLLPVDDNTLVDTQYKYMFGNMKFFFCRILKFSPLFFLVIGLFLKIQTQ